MSHPFARNGAVTVTAAIATQVAATPDRTAVVVGAQRLTYERTAAMADRVAAALRAGGVRPGDLVGVCLPRDEWLVPALLGVWRAGCGYVPLDPAYPRQRLRFMVADSGLRCLVAGGSAVADDLATGVPVVRVTALGEPPALPPPTDPSGDAPAYLLYTSGSTGQPKGVVIAHRNALAFLRWTAAAYTAEELAGCLAAASVCFDFSILELFAPLCTGGTVILADNLLALPTLPARDEVRMLCGVPSALSALLDFGLPPAVRTVNTGGEALTGALRDRLYDQPGVRRLVNLYGPTEGATACLAYDVTAGPPGEPPLGRPIAGAELAVRDPANGTPVPDGEPGELWLAGPGVSPGYLNRPELTADRFVREDGRRWYRTGDLVRVVDGLFRYSGRIDDQVKVRGHRVELGEVEANLLAHPAVRLATVLAPADAYGARGLVGYVEADGPVTEPELRRHLADRLPGYLVPDRVAVLPRLPLAGNGKVDRHALPALAPVAAPVVQPPADPVMARLAAIAAEVLELPAVEVDAPLSEYGCHSLAAARICARAGADFGVTVPVVGFLREPTVRALAGLVAEAETAAPLEASGVGRHPLTRMQRQLWALRQVTGNPAVTLVAVRLGLTADAGSLSAETVSRGLADLVARHEALRTRIVDEDGEPVAIVSPPSGVPLRTHDLRTLPAERRRRAADEVAAVAARQPFEPAAEVPLIRADLVRLADDRAELVLTVDHLVFDGWSVGPVLAGLAASLSGAPVAGGRHPQLGDVALAEREADADPDGYWQRALAGVIPPDDLPGTSRTRPPAGTGGRVVRPLAPGLPIAVGALAARYGSTPFGVYAAALAVLLDCLLSRADVLVGVVAAERDRPELSDVVGPMVDVLPVRLDLGDDPPFATLARRAARAAGDALAHGGTPAAARARAAGVVRPNGTMLTPVVLSVQPETVPVRAAAGPVRVELLGELETGAAQSDLAVFVNATATGTELQIEYADDRFERAAVVELADRLVRLVEQAVADPARPVSGLDGLGTRDRTRLLALADGGPPPEAPLRTVPEAIVARAALHPAAPAVRDDDGELDYAGLVDTADRIAGALLARGIGTGDLVAVCLPRDRLLPATLLGIWRAGAAYLPLDPALPPRRLRDLIADAGAVAAVASAETQGILPAEAVVLVDELVATGQPRGPRPAVQPDGLAYVLYTSGSTGTPKGVEVGHASLAWFVATTDALVGVGTQDIFLAVNAVTSDISCFDLWVPLALGASTVVVSRELAVDGAALGERMTATGVTLLNVTPTQLRVLVAGGWKGHAALRMVSGGEALDGTLAGELHARGAEVWNAYGPTEATVTTTYHRASCPPEALVPIGRPSPGALTYVVDRAGRLVPPGVTGELWIGGAGVARGYRGDPERTAATFVRDPFRPGGRCYRTGDLVRWRADGLLEFVGRDDDQVKVHGYRIELGEVEAALRSCAVVADAAVTVHRAGTPQAQLVGHLVGHPGVPLDPAAVEAEVREVLPPALVPRRWLTPASLPRNATGKVDRLTLAATVGTDSPTGPARDAESDVERYLVRLWGEVLDAPGVGVDDDFFALGGDSLAATRLAGRVREELGVDVGARLLFEHPVLAAFAVELEDRALDLLDAEDEG